MDEKKFDIQQKKLERDSDKSEQELAHEEFDSNLENAKTRLETLTNHLEKIKKGEQILEAQYDKAWKEYNNIRDVNLVNMDNLRKKYGLSLVEQIKGESGVLNIDYYNNATSQIQNRMVQINNEIIQIKKKLTGSN